MLANNVDCCDFPVFRLNIRVCGENEEGLDAAYDDFLVWAKREARSNELVRIDMHFSWSFSCADLFPRCEGESVNEALRITKGN